MALFPSIKELFGSPAPAAPLSTAQQAVATTAAQQQGGTAASNPTVPSTSTPQSDGAVGAIPAAGKGDASPLSEYSKMWEAKAPEGSTVASLTPSITANPEEMMKAAKSYDFTKGMDPTMLDAAIKGDATALAGLINNATQAGFAAAATASVSITKNALIEQGKNFETKYAPHMLRSADIASEVSRNIPLSADPAAAPIVAALTKQLSAQFPSAGAEEVSQHVEKYLEHFSRSIVESKGGRVQTAKDLLPPAGSALSREEPDWGKFFGVDATTMQ